MEPVQIGCIIGRHWMEIYCSVCDDEYYDYHKPVPHNCPYKNRRRGDNNSFQNRLIFYSCDSDTFMCRIELNVNTNVPLGEAVNGTVISWFEGMNKSEAITKVTQFNFCTTTADSDFTQLEPFIDVICEFIGFDDIRELASTIANDISRNFRNIRIRGNKPEVRSRAIWDHYREIIEDCRKKSIEKVATRLNTWNFERVVDPINIRFATPIAKTFVDAMISRNILSKLPIDQKTCPHMTR